MKILAIDTSCDDTSVSVVRQNNGKFEILSNIVSSQVKLHAEYGGVYPTLAKREHQKNLVPVLIKALQEAGILKIFNFQFSIFNQFTSSNLQTFNKILEREETLKQKTIQFLEKYEKPEIDAIAVTDGPGLEPCLWVGINFAKTLAFAWDLKIIPVNHIEAHLLANIVNGKEQIEFPAIGLIVSGGHTQLVLIEAIGKYQTIGETLDDACGECFDKTARILGLGYPGGPAIAVAAKQWSVINNPPASPNETLRAGQLSVKLPRPMINSKNMDFSFSGLKTAVLYDYKKRTPDEKKSKEYIPSMAKEIQQSIIDVLIKKTIKAANTYVAKTIIIGGGVSANEELRQQFRYKLQTKNSELNFLIPEKNLSTDNAGMIGLTAFFHLKNKKSWDKINAQANLKI